MTSSFNMKTQQVVTAGDMLSPTDIVFGATAQTAPSPFVMTLQAVAERAAIDLPLFSNVKKGLAPQSDGGTTTFLRADATFSNTLTGAFLQTPPVVNGDAYWSSDPTPGKNVNIGGRVLAGDAATGSEAQLSGTSWVSDPAQLGAHWMLRSALVASVTPNGGTAVFGATRNGDKYATPIQSVDRTVWGIGQAITAGMVRANRFGVYQATNNGTTAFPGPSHKSGSSADGGGVIWSFLSDRNSYMVPIAGSFVSTADVSDGEGTWTLYQESNRQAGGGVSFGREVAVKNKGSNVVADPFNVVQDGATIGDWFAGGGDASYFGAPANPSTVAIAIGRNSAAWNSGIIFTTNSLTITNGRAGAIQMANNHEIQWFGAAGVTKFGIRYDNNASAREARIVSNGFGTDLRGVRSTGAEETLFSIAQPDLSAAGARTNFFFVDANVNTGAAGSGHVQLTASGYDTNIDIRLTPKGSGLVRFGNSTGAASVPANFTADRILYIKDGSGVAYAIPCRATGW